MRRLSRMLIPGLLWLCACAAMAGDIGLTYVKTIGQVSPDNPMLTGGGRLSVDEKGCLYAGTPGPDSHLQKFTPNGRLVWRADDTHCAYTGTAVDDKYVYGCGIGYYGWGHLLRRKKDSGAVPAGWNYVWPKATDVVNGVRGFTNPGALLVDNTCLYILDLGNGELRRLDKVSGAEKAFATPIKVIGANDMAFSAAGSLLVLTADTVVEFDRATGKALRPQMITGLRGACAIAVNRKANTICIGEGGTPENPINKVRIFSAAGVDTGATIGRGGEWQGKWSADAFNFACGAADIAFDSAGGFWTNCYGARMGFLGLLVHFSPTFQPDKTFLAACGEGIAVDSELNITLGGNYQFSWDGNLRWTSGLVSSGKPNQFPTTISYWLMQPVYADTKRVIIMNIHGNSLFMLDGENGANAGKGYGLPAGPIKGSCVAGQHIFIAIADAIHHTTADLPPLDKVMNVPDPVKAKGGLTGLAMSDDLKRIYISAGNGADARVYAFDRGGGAPLWEAKAGAICARYKGMLLTTNPNGAGIMALSAEDGGLSTVFNIGTVKGVAIAGKDGIDYLCVAAQNQVRIYRIAAAE